MISFEKFGFVVDCFLCELVKVFLYKIKFLRFLLIFKCPFNFDFFILSIIDKLTTKESWPVNVYCILQYKLSRWGEGLGPACESAAASATIALEARQFSLNLQYT